MKRFIVIVIDSFGVGEMADTKNLRPEDIGANTAGRLIRFDKDIKLPGLEKLGLMNVLGFETDNMHFSRNAIYARSNLKHYGADTFYGHQEIMGTNPIRPEVMRFNDHIDEVEKDLNDHGYRTRRFGDKGHQVLFVNEMMGIGDNIETDPGQAINVTASFDLTNFDEVKKVGKIVRKHYKVPRIIAFGGKGVKFQDIVNAIKVNGDFVGIDAPMSGVYNDGYLVQHIGYGIDTSVQLPHILPDQGVHVYLYGKVADIVDNPNGTMFYGVDTTMLLNQLYEDLKANKEGFYCLNVQETDLAGHAENPKRYIEKLHETDIYLEKIMAILKEDDIMVVMADHGNDPFIGHSHHTREKVPLLVYCNNGVVGSFKERETMADVAATVAEYFKTKTQFGTSFLKEIKKEV
ncbi:MAG: phosphopentomutase [Acholeplasma sp.]|nr:phosphopentomutase [Acholeplasma sp.]